MKRIFLSILFVTVMISSKAQMSYQSENMQIQLAFEPITSILYLNVTNLSEQIMYLNAREARYDKIENDFFNGYHSCICISSAGISLARPQESSPMTFHRLSPDSTIQINIGYPGYYASEKIESTVFALLLTIEYLLLSKETSIKDMIRNEDLMRLLKEEQYKIHMIEIEGKMTFE